MVGEQRPAEDVSRKPASTLPAEGVSRAHEPRVLFIVSNYDGVLRGKGEKEGAGHKTGTYLPEIAVGERVDWVRVARVIPTTI